MRGDQTFSAFYLQEIADNCKLILTRIKTHEMTAESYAHSSESQDLLAMPMLRICEIIARFEHDLAKLCPRYDWQAAAKMRNQIAHPYGGFDFSFVWDAAQEDIPELLKVTEQLL
ncbi:MAG: DUF86 domain-containing protein [Coriobacteriales bacterium]|jgi:uncharacterized protein with HEPN domain|nr:DUF86 domain-containing protein [Coriobacteriales bacterium]